jgi:methionine biosynthesis protein MetW
VTVYSELVGRHGLAPSHALLLEAVPAGAQVLDVGCAEGYLARALVARGCTVVGLEFDERAAEVARGACERVVTGDVEDPDVRAQVDTPFDRVLFGDVLEHLADPAAVLRWAVTLLGADGRAVVSLPNIAHWTGRRELARGRFPRADHGLFDRTHVRFFTRATARELVEDAGLIVEDEAFTPAPLPLQSRLPALGKLTPALLKRRPELFALQVVLTCRAASQSQPAP